MASIIEKAAQRLEELRRAGVSIPGQPGLLGGAAVLDAGPIAREGPQDHGLGGAPAGAASPKPRHHVDVDVPALERAGLLVPTGIRSPGREEFRHIKRPLLRNVRDGKPEDRMSLVMVTSALPGEGKTFCSINLAISVALEIDLSVMLVDADVLRPGVLKRLGLAPHKGLLDLLTDSRVDITDVLLATNIPKMSVLPAGTFNSRSAELLDSSAMNRLLADLASRFHDHLIIFDAPPLLPTNEAKVLASRVGQVLMVIEASKTPRSAIERALASVQQCPNVMFVLNRAHEPLRRYGYGYGYGYGDEEG